MALKTVNEESLVALGNAIREKTNTNERLIFPDGMIDAIESISTSGEVPDIVLTGNCKHGCAGALGSQYLKLFGDKVITSEITSSDYMFCYNTELTIPFDIYYASGSNSMSYMFEYSKITRLPNLHNARPNTLQYFCSYCYYLRDMPEDLGSDWDWKDMLSSSSAYGRYLFMNCYSLRRVSAPILSNLGGKAGTSYSWTL